jgi:polysaccharide export outer membrane protein
MPAILHTDSQGPTRRMHKGSNFIAQLLMWVALQSFAPLALSAADPGDYRLGTGDLLKITVFNNPDLSTDVRVSQSGNITYPLIGEVPVKGLSTRDVEKLITTRLGDGGFLRGAQVSALVTDYQSQKIAVMGQVARPGQYALTQANKVLDVLAAAGGTVTGLAADQATLIRQDGTKFPIDLVALFEGDPRQNPPVGAGDTVFVPRAPQFYVYGEVQRPGMYRLERGMTVSQAISAGGGLTARGTEHRAMVKRRDTSGKEARVTVRGSDLLKADDVLYVKESLF